MITEKKFAFLGDSFPRFIVLVAFVTIGLIAEKILNYRYVVVQKAVQGGAVAENWQSFMHLTGLIILVSVILTIIKIFFIMWGEKVQKVNFFKVYNGVIQEDAKLQGSLKEMTAAFAKVKCVIDSMETIINSTYVVILMGVVVMSLPEYIGAGAILLAGLSFGVVRGKMQAQTDLLGAETQTLQQKLSNFFMISSDVLDERLGEIESNYWRIIGLQCL